MAGRGGTDIKLGEGVKEVGGLHVICTELHEAQRIDRQLIGRCGRQGDPGTYRQFMSLDDEILLLGLGPKRAKRLEAFGRKATGLLSRFESLFRKAQRRVERRHFRDRKVLLYHEKERQKGPAPNGARPIPRHPGVMRLIPPVSSGHPFSGDSCSHARQSVGVSAAASFHRLATVATLQRNSQCRGRHR